MRQYSIFFPADFYFGIRELPYEEQGLIYSAIILAVYNGREEGDEIIASGNRSQKALYELMASAMDLK